MPLLSRLSFIGIGKEARTDSAGTTSGSATVTDVSIVSGDVGANVIGAGIPVGAVVATVSAGVSFTMTYGVGGAAANATATASPSITVAKQGTAVAPTLYIPVTMHKGEDVFEYVRDESIAANPTLVRGVYQGERDTTFDFDGWLFPEVIGFLLTSAGFYDTVSGGSPYTHTFKQLASGAQPPSYTITVYNNVTTRQYPGCVLDQLDITVDAKGAIKYSAKFKGWGTTTTTKPSPSFPSSASMLGWQTAPSIGGTGIGRLISSQMTVKRSTESIHTINNTQNPWQVFAGPVEADWKLKALFENEVDWTHLTANDQVAMQLVTTVPGGGTSPVFTQLSTTAPWVKASRDNSGKFEQLDADVTGVYSATDLGPVQFTLVNGTATAY